MDRKVEATGVLFLQMDWSADGKVLMSNSLDHEAKFWDRKGRPTADQSQRDQEWDDWTCPLGFPVMGIWGDGMDGTYTLYLNLTGPASSSSSGHNNFCQPCQPFQPFLKPRASLLLSRQFQPFLKPRVLIIRWSRYGYQRSASVGKGRSPGGSGRQRPGPSLELPLCD